MAIVGDIPDEEFGARESSESPPLPSPPPSTARVDFSDEVPPEVPRRTQASQELVASSPATSENPIVPDVDSLYEQPTPRKPHTPLWATPPCKLRLIGSPHYPLPCDSPLQSPFPCPRRRRVESKPLGAPPHSRTSLSLTRAHPPPLLRPLSPSHGPERLRVATSNPTTSLSG